MDQITNILMTYNIEIMITILVIFILSLILNIIWITKINELKKHYTLLLNGRDGIEIEKLMIETAKDANDLRDKLILSNEKIKEIETKLSFAVQKVGFIRYNAFAEMGSDLSFSIALLDDFQNGLVVTSIYGREQASVYGKPIKLGKSVYPLSVEEIQAIDRANMSQIAQKTF